MLILASKSPRRKELLESAGFTFQIKTIESDEVFDLSKDLEDALIDVAYQKGEKVFQENPNDTIISADTIVVCDNELLGKPKDHSDAVRMLSKLSNKIHQVLTGVVIFNKDEIIRFVEKTDVYFKDITLSEIEHYISIENVYDKAGAYAIQGYARNFIEKFVGDYENVIGLPITKVTEELNKLNKKSGF